MQAQQQPGIRRVAVCTPGRGVRGAVMLAGVLLASCDPASRPVAQDPATSPPRAAQQTQQSNLLLFPVADAEALLGRAVQATAQGGWTIAESRAPGCEVAVRRTRAEYSTRRQVDLHDLTSLSVGFAKFIGIEAQYGKAVVADIQIDNTEVLNADTRGPCGELIVDSVFVGRGKRTLSVSTELAGKLGVTIGTVTPGIGHATNSSVLDSTEWKTDQAYGFTARKEAGTRPLELKVGMPSIVSEGDAVEVSLEASRKAYLVVYYLEADGKAELLWPSVEEPEPMVQPGIAARLPSERERAAGIVLKAALRKSGESAREMLVAYAFTEKGDFDRLKPAAGSSDADGAAYAAQLTRRIGDIPLSRWSRALGSYTIAPKRK
jgi:hypothetical protein